MHVTNPGGRIRAEQLLHASPTSAGRGYLDAIASRENGRQSRVMALRECPNRTPVARSAVAPLGTTSPDRIQKKLRN
jgi:hypothetical protein